MLKVKLGKARDLVVPSLYADSAEPESGLEAGGSQPRRTDSRRNSYSYRSAKSAKSMFANCKLVDWTGRAVSSTSYKSLMLAPSAHPDFQDFEISIPAEEGLPGAAFVRIAIYIGNHSENIGSIFVPISAFTCSEKMLQLPLVRFKKMKIFTGDTPAPDIPLSGITTGLGELTVTISKDMHTLTDSNDSTHIIRLKSILRETSVLNCTWYAECLLAGSVEKPIAVKEVEKLALLTSFDGMILLDNFEGGSAQFDSNMVEEDKDDIMESNDKSDRRSSVSLMQRLQSASGTVVTMEVTVFQNEHRLPGSKRWTSSMNLTRPRYSDLLFKVGYKFRSLDQAKPPDGFTWDNSTWEIDRRFESSDPDGWRYGTQLGSMVSENASNSNLTNASKSTCARRRKWVRIATLLHRDTMDNVVGDNVLFNAAVFAAANNDLGDSSFPKKLSSNAEQGSSNGDWRREISSSKQATVIGVCKEKSSPYSPAIIPWSQVLSVTVVTPSVLSIRFIVNRYIPPLSKDTGRDPFQRAEIEMFVSNCPAYELSCIVDERTTFSQTRENIRLAIINRSCTVSVYDKDVECVGDGNDDEDSDGAFPETEGLSSGSDIIAELDLFAIDLEMKVRELEDKLFLIMKEKKLSDVHELTDSAIWQEMQFSLRKSSRARLYLAAMLELNLKGAKSCTGFVVEGLQDERKIANIAAIETLKSLARDSKLSSRICLENEVATANNRIGEYVFYSFFLSKLVCIYVFDP